VVSAFGIDGVARCHLAIVEIEEYRRLEFRAVAYIEDHLRRTPGAESALDQHIEDVLDEC